MSPPPLVRSREVAKRARASVPHRHRVSVVVPSPPRRHGVCAHCSPVGRSHEGWCPLFGRADAPPGTLNACVNYGPIEISPRAGFFQCRHTFTERFVQGTVAQDVRRAGFSVSGIVPDLAQWSGGAFVWPSTVGSH